MRSATVGVRGDGGRRPPRRDRRARRRRRRRATPRSTSSAELQRGAGMSTWRSTASGLLVTNTERRRAGRRPRRGRGRLGPRRRPGPAPPCDERIDVDGRCVIPGFVDSHTHLVFAGDRSAEFAARMAGAPYEAGGINVTIEATRAAADDELRRAAAARLDEARRAGITTIEVKTGYGGDRRRRGASRRARPAELTPETTFLGAHVVPPGWDRRRLRRAGLRRDARRLRTARALDRRLLRARGVRCRPVPAGAGGRAGGRARAAPARQPARPRAGRAARRRARVRVGRPLHVPVRRRRRRAGRRATRWRRSSRRRTSRPASRTPTPAVSSTPGATVALATNCNPGSSYTTSMSFVIALAVRDLHMTRRRSAARGDARRRPGAAPRRRRLARPRLTRRPRRPRRPQLHPPRLPPRRPPDPPHDPSECSSPSECPDVRRPHFQHSDAIRRRTRRGLRRR